MKRTVMIGLLLRVAVGCGCLAQTAADPTNAWQKQVYPLQAEAADERSRVLLQERGAYFDQFAPKTPGGYVPVGSVGEMGELPTVMSDAIVIAKFSDHQVHLTPSGKYVYTERIFTALNVVVGGPGNIHANTQLSVLDNGGAILKPNGEIVRIALFQPNLARSQNTPIYCSLATFPHAKRMSCSSRGM